MWQNFWNLRVNDRLTQWKDFRHQLDRLPLESALVELNNMWSTAPIVNYNLDPSDPGSWPDPWTLLAENYYCNIAKSLGMLYTIYFTSHGNGLDVEIYTYNDVDTGYTYNLCVLGAGKYVINFLDNKIVNIESINKKLKLTRCYGREELKL